MITRRELIQVGAGAAASSAVLAGTVDTRSSTARSHELSAVLTDGSLDARAFGAAARARGLEVHEIGADLAEIYCRDLQPLWKDGSARPVGGLTGAAPLFYIERLAWDAGLRIVLLGRHEAGASGQARHSIRGPRDTVDGFQMSSRLIDWRIALANLLKTLPISAPTLKPLSAVRDAVIAGDRALFSWVLAPVARAASARGRR
jgi:hypothetical protein